MCTIAAIDAIDDDGNDRGLFLPRDCDPLAIRLAPPHTIKPLLLHYPDVCSRGKVQYASGNSDG